MRDIVWRTEDTRGGYQERILGTLNELAVVEPVGLGGKPSAIWCAFEQYRDLPRHHGLPLAESFRPEQMRDIAYAAMSSLSWIDVEAEDPENYVFHGHRGLCNVPAYPNIDGFRIGDHPIQRNARSLVEEYRLCINSRSPLYHEITQVYGGARRCYRRILLPAVDMSGDVVRLIMAMRVLELPTSGTAANISDRLDQ